MRERGFSIHLTSRDISHILSALSRYAGNQVLHAQISKLRGNPDDAATTCKLHWKPPVSLNGGGRDESSHLKATAGISQSMSNSHGRTPEHNRP